MQKKLKIKKPGRISSAPQQGPDLSLKGYFKQLIHPHPEGVKFILAAACVAVILAWLTIPFFGFLGLLLTIGVALFFRDPERCTPKDENAVIAPADGIVCFVDKVPPPPELDMGDAVMNRVCIFMSVFNVHVNRSPIAGTIAKTEYCPGKFLNASLDKASLDNERQLYLIKEQKTGAKIAVVQIAGLVARRIVSFVQDGATLEKGERFGLIRFGSRVDVYMPIEASVNVQVGQTMIAGETIIGKL